MARKSTQEPIEPELNLAPIMNMVMILIPLLLVMVEFEEFAMSPVEATSSGGAASSDSADSDEVRPPRLLISISEDGFRIADFFSSPDFAEFSEPISRCGSEAGGDGGSGVPTVCLEPGATPEPGEYASLDYAGLYNRLVEIRLHEPWREAYSKPENGILLLTAESDVPAAVLVRTMDLGRYFLDPAGEGLGGLAHPLEDGVSDVSAYLLGDGEATRQDLLQAGFFLTDDSTGLNRHKDGSPSNLLPMFPSVSIVSPR